MAAQAPSGGASVNDCMYEVTYERVHAALAIYFPSLYLSM